MINKIQEEHVWVIGFVCVAIVVLAIVLTTHRYYMAEIEVKKMEVTCHQMEVTCHETPKG